MPRKKASLDIVDEAKKTVSKAKRDVSANKNSLPNARAKNTASDKGASTVAKSKPRKTASQAKSKAVDAVKGIGKKVSKAKNDVVSQENPTPDAVAETATFDQGAGAVRRRKPRKLVRKAETASFTGSQPMGLLSADDVSVGPLTDVLKEKFSAQKIPLQTDFAELIDVADCGRKAAGLNPAQSGGTGAGLLLDAEERLAVQAGIGISVDSTGVNIDSTQLLVKGMIMMFSGSVAPAGWAFCDGVDGRPNLLNRFILGGSGSEVGTSGGASLSGIGTSKIYSVATNAVSAGTITVTVGNTTLTIDQMPAHSHESKNTWNTGAGAGGYTSFTQGNTPSPETRNLIYNTGGSKPHTHTGAASQGTHSHTVSTLPAYYILAFIIKL